MKVLLKYYLSGEEIDLYDFGDTPRRGEIIVFRNQDPSLRDFKYRVICIERFVGAGGFMEPTVVYVSAADPVFSDEVQKSVRERGDHD